MSFALTTTTTPLKWPPTVYRNVLQPRGQFLLPLRIGEQESKARMHFTQILELAGHLNRTLVLPNVGNSRLGACLEWDFATYYDVDALLDGDLDVLSMADFEWWVSGAPNRPTAQILSVTLDAHPLGEQNLVTITDGSLIYATGPFLDPGHPRLSSCLPRKPEFQRLNVDHFPPGFIYPHPSIRGKLNRIPIGPLLVDLLAREELYAEAFEPFDTPEVILGAYPTPDVLVLNWDLRHPAFHNTLSTPQQLTYSPDLVRLADNLAPPAPCIAVHWRMETVPPDVLPSCAASLIDTLMHLVQRQHRGRHNLWTVWLATDYVNSVGEGLIAKSGTFKHIGEAHEEAVGVLRKAFESGGRLEGWKIVGLSEALSKMHPNLRGELPIEDTGVWGVLDKMVSMRATLFVSGGRRCARTR